MKEYKLSDRNGRRTFLKAAGLAAILPDFSSLPVGNNFDESKKNYGAAGLVVTNIHVHVVKVNERGDWYFIELKTNKGIVGLGECSHAFSKSFPQGDEIVKKEAFAFFKLIKGESPFNIEWYRQRGFARANDKLKKTVFSGIEQALWDICGKTLGVPSYQLLGGKVRDKIRVYANINRATNDHDSNGKRPVASFQKNAEQALKNGFTAVKLAPFDEMRPLATSTPAQVDEDIQYAINCIEGVRSTIGNEIDLLIDVHSHLNVDLARQTAKRIESSNLYWFEEPVDPQKYPSETKSIEGSISQVLAGGESIFGREGYAGLINSKALGIVMPDVKHCGGLLECKYIAAMAETAGNVKVAPHNPSGPVATAASVTVCAGISNFAILEYAFGEVPWSNNLVEPAEQFINGHLLVSNAPGLGITLNYNELRKRTK
jgi:galactonate dehydratase